MTVNQNTILQQTTSHTNHCSRRQVLAAAAGLLLLGRISVWPGRLATAGLKGLGNVARFGVLADPHVDIRGKNGWRMGAISVLGLEKTVSAMNEAGLDFVLVPGDLLLDGEWENLEVAKKLLDRLVPPYYIVSGNHDYRPADPGRLRKGFSYLTTAEFIEVFKSHGYSTGEPRYWTHLLDSGLRLIGLDGCLPQAIQGWGGFLDDVQFHWLQEQLGSSQEPILIMVHHCLLHWGSDGTSRTGRWNSLENSPQVRSLLSRYREKIVMVISGHRHIGLHYRVVDGVAYFVVPSINSYPMRYSLFELVPDHIQWTTPDVGVSEELHGEAFDGLLRTPWFTVLDPASRDQLLQFYENNSDRKGVLPNRAGVVADIFLSG